MNLMLQVKDSRGRHTRGAVANPVRKKSPWEIDTEDSTPKGKLSRAGRRGGGSHDDWVTRRAWAGRPRGVRAPGLPA